MSKANKRQAQAFEVQAQFQTALALHQQGRIADAIRIYEEILQKIPDHFGALNLLGVIACQNRACERAVQLISKAISINPNVPAAHSNLGVALRELKRHEEALSSFDRAIALKPDYAEAHHNRGLALKELGRPEEAIASYDKAISLKPDCEACYNRGNVLAELKRFEDAIASYDNAIALNPNYADAHCNRGNALKEVSRLEQALLSYERAIALRPSDAESHSNRGHALKELRRLEEALVSYDRAIALKPDYADTHASRGTTLHELKRFEEALVSYNQAIASEPNKAEIHYNRGLVLKELKRNEEALLSYDKAIALKPDFAECYCARGFSLNELQRFREALACCDRAIQLRSEFAEAHFNRGFALFELDAFEEALASYTMAFTLRPDMADAHNNAGDTLLVLGRLSEARAAYLRAIDADPTNPTMYFNFAYSTKFAPNDSYLRTLEIIAAGSEQLQVDKRIALDFTLSKVYADLNDHRRSFTHLLSANSAKRSVITYDEKAEHAAFDAVERVFTLELITAKSGHGHLSQRPIFVLGMPRSGTTLVEQILASHPAVYAGGELQVFSQIAVELGNIMGPNYPNYVPLLELSDLMNIGQQYLTEIDCRAPEHKRVTDKMPANFLFVGLIHLALPNTKIIHAMRDPIDTCVSCFSKLFAKRHEFTYDLGELGRYYKRYEHLMAHWRNVLPQGRMLEVQYEDVVADLETQARRILEYCELPWDDRCLSFHETDRPVRTASLTQVRQPIYKSAVGRWREYEEFLGPLFEALGISPACADEATEAPDARS